jgi:hypothetical protein
VAARVVIARAHGMYVDVGAVGAWAWWWRRRRDDWLIGGGRGAEEF